ncbi:unnamed protein product [Ilex paraguariensis]|uniref:Organ-specific protein S2 n=1 Tax=Ilex paraguariensis TaxID=185542 RepID=A0ABC8SA21_9AQUA
MQSNRSKNLSVYSVEAMGSAYAFWALLSLVLFVSIIDARPDPREYWKGVMKDQPTPEVIQNLIRKGTEAPHLSDKKNDCQTSMETAKNDKLVGNFENTKDQLSTKEFQARSNPKSYRSYGDTQPMEDELSVKEFEPRPNPKVYEAYADAMPIEDKSLVKKI